ncbi:MAG: HDOD domain-containing protein [Helicobacter sp.]|nr:HDOD domain-containing protein [Helicobacter sp.]
MKNFISSEIESLPPLPQTIIELQRICANEDTTIKQVSSVIEKDPFLTADLIKCANSPLYGCRRSVDSVFLAVSMFGIGTAKGLAIASAVKSNFIIDLSPYNLSTHKFTEISNLKSAFIMQWFNDKKQLHSTLIPCALLMYLGMAIIADCLRKRGEISDFLKNFDKENQLDSEKQLLNCTHLDVLKSLFKYWNFDEKITKVVESLAQNDINNDLEIYTAPLLVLNKLITPFSSASLEQIKDSINLVESYNLDKDSFINTLKNMQLYKEGLES